MDASPTFQFGIRQRNRIVFRLPGQLNIGLYNQKWLLLLERNGGAIWDSIHALI